jgi:hypothetical protein
LSFSESGEEYVRLAKDYEVKAKHSEALIYAAAAHLMLRRLAPSPIKWTFFTGSQ